MRSRGTLRQNSAMAFPVLICLSMVAGCRKNADQASEASVTVQAAHPIVAPIAQEIAADAILAPLSQAAISPRISAPIRAEYVQRGSRVHRGQLLVSLENRDLRGSAQDSSGAVIAAKAALTVTTRATIPEEVKKAEADAAQAQIAVDVAHRTTEERRKLSSQGAISGRELDTAIAAEAQAKATYETARAHAEGVTHTTQITDREAAQGQLTSANGRLQNAEAQVSYANLRSPIDGVVTDRPFFPGETAAAGTPVVTVMDISSLLAKLHLAQAASQQLALGRQASVTVPGLHDPVDASVAFISPALDPGSTTVEVWLRLPNAKGQFKVGTPVHVVITGQAINNALLVPASAIVPGDESGVAVMVISADGAVHRKPVTVGIRTSEKAQILTGLSASDTVITDGGYGLDEGTKVKVGKPNEEDKKDSAQKDKG